MGFPAKAFTALLASVLSGSLWLWAQTSASPSAKPPSAEATDAYPEQGYLSASHYLNQYFDFAFDLPPEAHLQPIPQAASRDGSLQVLELGGPPPADAEIAITAVPLASEGRNQDAKSFLRFALDQELFTGVEELRGLSKAELSGHQFYLFETRRGVEQHMLLATTLDGYIVRVVLASHDERMLKQLESSFQHIVFFPPAELRQHLDASAHAYDGPTISSHRLASLQSDPPINHLDPGKISGDFYENAALAFNYRIPQGWILEAEGAVQPAVERDRVRQNYGRPSLGANERRLLEACSRTLFSAWAKRPGADGQIPYDDFGEVTVTATSTACFPEMKFPQDANDRQAFKDFLLQYGVTHPILADMRDAKAFTAGGHTFLVLHGTVAFRIPEDELARRLSISLAVTEQKGYLLSWFFAAPHDSELQALTDQRVSFDSVPPITSAGTTQPGGGTASSTADISPAAANSPATAAASQATANPSSSTADAAPGAQAGTTAASSPAPADPPESSAPAHPSLLRPGETMQSQQGKGAPIKK